jgi:hypothetical protein
MGNGATEQDQNKQLKLYLPNIAASQIGRLQLKE